MLLLIRDILLNLFLRLVSFLLGVFVVSFGTYVAINLTFAIVIVIVTRFSF